MSSETDRTPAHPPSMFAPQNVILAITLVVLLFLLWLALQPDFKGGRFITYALVIGVGLVATVLVQTVSASIVPTSRRGDDARMRMDEREEFGWSIGARMLLLVAGLFAAILFLGMMVGMAVATFLIARIHMRASYRTCGVFAIGLGLALPVFFSVVLDVAIWPGMIPEIVPRWLGGGILPPL